MNKLKALTNPAPVDPTARVTKRDGVLAIVAALWVALMPVIVGSLFATYCTGCQTRVTATKNPETVTILENGQPLVTSGGWEFTARSPLYATEALDGFSAEVGTNGYVKVGLNKYSRDLSTNSVVMVEKMFSGGAQLVTSIGDAYVKIAGGGAQATTVLDVAQKVYSAFTSAGGDATKATVSTDTATSTLTVSDGTTCVTCDKDGNCTSVGAGGDGDSKPTTASGDGDSKTTTTSGGGAD